MNILAGFISIFQPLNLLLIVIGVVVGVVFGAVPGFTGVMAIALLLPFTFSLDTVGGLLMLLGVYCGGAFGGSVSSILIGTPGSPEAAATVLDGYPLAKKGKAYKALSMAAFASTVGGLISAVSLLLFAPLIAKAALLFGPPEYFMLGIFGITVIAGVSGNHIGKGIQAGCIGVFLTTIGLDQEAGVMRFTAGNIDLYSGISMLPIILGAFALNRVFQGVQNSCRTSGAMDIQDMSSREKLTKQEYRSCMKTIGKSSIIGVIIGAIPAAGADIAAWLSYNEAKRSSKDGARFGTGVLEGVAAPEAGNNAITGASLIPLLTLGIPGSGGAATLLGALMMHGLAPGPSLFKEHGDTMYIIMLGLVFVNIFMYIIVKFLSRYFIHITRIPEKLLVAALLVIALFGAYISAGSQFDVLVALCAAAGIYVLTLFEFPVIPLILGFILGPTIEANLRRSMVMLDGNLLQIFTRPICLMFVALSVFMVVLSKKTLTNPETQGDVQLEGVEV